MPKLAYAADCTSNLHVAGAPLANDEDQDNTLAREDMIVISTPQNFSGLTKDQRVGGLAPWQEKRIVAFVENQIAQKITIDDLAKVAKLSTSYFAAAFKRSFGISPYAYIVKRRVEFAKRQMLQSRAPLCEIALNCGLSDQSHLSRVFRRNTGMTPTGWRHSQSYANASSFLS